MVSHPEFLLSGAPGVKRPSWTFVPLEHTTTLSNLDPCIEVPVNGCSPEVSDDESPVKVEVGGVMGFVTVDEGIDESAADPAEKVDVSGC